MKKSTLFISQEPNGMNDVMTPEHRHILNILLPLSLPPLVSLVTEAQHKLEGIPWGGGGEIQKNTGFPFLYSFLRPAASSFFIL